MGFCESREKHIITPSFGALIQLSAICEETILDSTFHTDVQKYFTFKRVLGHGQFGTVREALRLGAHPMRVAIKSVRKEIIMQSLSLIKRELMIIRRLDHPNIVKFYETYEDAKYLHMVMELCEGGDLFDHVTSKDRLTESEVSAIMRKLMHGVNHMHGMNICHRDLKPENFLYASKAPDADIKIVDFGMSTRYANDENMTTIVGTPYYLAPEVIQGNYSNECDVWSLGVVMFFLLSGEQPFVSENLSDLYFRISNAHFSFTGEVWNSISGNAKDLVSLMLVPEPGRRIKLGAALKHAWFSVQHETTHNEVSGDVLRSLRRYKAPQKLQKEIIHLIVKYMTADDISELRVKPTSERLFSYGQGENRVHYRCRPRRDHDERRPQHFQRRNQAYHGRNQVPSFQQDQILRLPRRSIRPKATNERRTAVFNVQTV